MSIQLKVKYKTLSNEPSIIRTEIRKLKKQYQYLKSNGRSVGDIAFKMQKLIEHKNRVVRDEARATHLARSYISGIDYNRVEQHIEQPSSLVFKILPKTLRMIQKYHNPQTRIEDLHRWTTIVT